MSEAFNGKISAIPTSKYFEDNSMELNNTEIYNLEVTKELLNNALLNEAIDSNKGGEIVPYMQEIKKTNDDVGNLSKKYETLFRYKNKFSDKIESPAMLDGISDTTSEKVLKKMIDISTKNLDQNTSLSFNLNQTDLLSDTLSNDVKAILEKNGVKEEQIIFEILEDVKNTPKLNKKLKQYKTDGFKLAMDDFGVNESNFKNAFHYEKEGNLDIVKLDRIFFHDNKKDSRLKELIDKFQVKGLEVVIEGIENEEDLAIAKKLGVEYTQGYFHGKPIPYFKVKK